MDRFSFDQRISANPAVRYLLAIFVSAAALLICTASHDYIGRGGAYSILLLAVAISSWYGGLGPAILALLIALFAARLVTASGSGLSLPNAAESLEMLAL